MAPRCDICDRPEDGETFDGRPDWNGETGNHLTCEVRPARYYETAEYRAAVSCPFHVSLYADWHADPTTVGFQSEAEARAFASIRPEPLVDLVQRERYHDGRRWEQGVIAVRRMMPWHGTDWVAPRDDFSRH